MWQSDQIAALELDGFRRLGRLEPRLSLENDVESRVFASWELECRR
jgi:hypothetical protein